MSELERLFGGDNDGVQEKEEAPEPEVAEAPEPEVAEAEPEVAEAEPEVAEAEPEVAEAEPEPEPKQDWDDQARKIAHSARMAERRRMTQAFEKEKRELEEKFNERFKALEDKLKQPEPDFEQDPAGYLRHKQQLHDAELAALKAEREQLAQSQQKEKQFVESFRQTQATIQEYEAESASMHPDYYDALNFLRQDARKGMASVTDDHIDAQLEQAAPFLRTIGVAPRTRPEKEAAMLFLNEIQISQQLINAGHNPAEYMYQTAKRLGFKKPDPVEQVKRIEKGMKHATTLKAGNKVETPQLGEIDAILDDIRAPR